MSDDHQNFDPFDVLAEQAAHLNAICSPAQSVRVYYEIMSGSLIWSDEANEQTPVEVIWALRLIYAYRTGLILNEPNQRYKPLWDHALALFPDWVGFRLERRQPTPELLAIYRRGDVSLRWCLRRIERGTQGAAENGNGPD